jgi:hypothetical protein
MDGICQCSICSLKYCIDYLTQDIGCEAKELFFTVPSNDRLPNDETAIEFGRGLLQYCGIGSDQIISCNGSANYQKGYIASDDNLQRNTLGSRALPDLR